LGLDNEEIEDLLDRYEKDSKAIKQDILTMCWFMRGSISYDDGMMLSFDDRKIVNKIIKDNLETTKESGLPFF
jgi:hypothetical protein